MIALRQVALQRGTQTLLDNADITLNNGVKAGIIGANGAGKSSLFKLLLGELAPDQGDVEMSGGQRIAHMAQEVDALDRPIIEYVLDGDLALRQAEADLLAAQEAGQAHREAELHGLIETLDGYRAESRAAQLLVGLGFVQADLARPLSAFSGGWRMRVNLARTLFMPSDLLLLDEPTNHLDLDALLWLEQWLTRYPGTLLLISHDRDFLDAVCDHIVHMHHQTLELYRGNYSQFERTRAEKLALQQAEAAKQQARREEIERFIARFKAKATKAKQAQSRVKMLERMEDIAVAHVDSPFHFTLPAADKTSHPLLVLDQAQLGYRGKKGDGSDDNIQLDKVNVTLLPGSRIGLLGPNGAGKSTLIKSLTGELELLNGKRVPGEHLAIGYFAQHQLESLDVSSTPFVHVQRLSPTASDQDIRNFLGGFGFKGDDAFGTVANYSGGEKARLALALVAWQKPNLLLLDEPTNHLDLEMREALTQALASFEGTVILVSHDRHLLRATVDEFWRVADHRVEPFDGDLEDYRAWLKARLEESRRDSRGEKAERQNQQPSGDSREARKASRKAAAELREKLRPLKKQRDQAEKAMEKAQHELDKVEQVLADPELYTDSSRKAELTKTLSQQAEIKARLDESERQWLSAEEALETMEAELLASEETAS
ncbi:MULTISPECIES: ATP-binding cassette domain-containing protein [Halomonadaceae]|jgi:ATP-binding cassette, subfamily F, member 3|uniref:ATP-binding cassette domain-containing protein n=1 Tax=Halomonadaceae TaxID=28256 RepID=UPI00034DC80D|nr:MULTISPECIES: ATP-binding cassette domain-containing protein [Halomonas]UEQ04047.1 ATP-binding cassette domain-containing protein [Halomonas profundus]NVE89081.1 ATP-binding cassette domain-containing protein [Halomonas titanicae]QNU63852.1 ATP-binding cassette domain-containing protein [Halomonas titanicae]TMU28348.1 ATP-binding cassette domain-containing protein [Halomonas sp. ATBC28]CAD5249018.1 fused putative transporter subunits of ABC superfamily: ATP-binding components [Halomonas sp.|tara:strand:- start:906 stop:2882 length:1977 start_codon:yes stop_codon:yes gene_type:complete